MCLEGHWTTRAVPHTSSDIVGGLTRQLLAHQPVPVGAELSRIGRQNITLTQTGHITLSHDQHTLLHCSVGDTNE